MSRELPTMFRPSLGMLIIVLTYAFLAWIVHQTQDVEIIFLVVGAILGYASAVVQFVFGSSQGSVDKTDMLKKPEVAARPPIDDMSKD